MYSYEESQERWAGARTMSEVSVATIFSMPIRPTPPGAPATRPRNGSGSGRRYSGGIRALGSDAGGPEDADTAELVAEHADPVDLWAKIRPAEPAARLAPARD